MSTEVKEKLRTVIHYEDVNKCSWISEAMKLPGHAAIVAKLAYLASGGDASLGESLQSKSDFYKTLQEAIEGDKEEKKKRANAGEEHTWQHHQWDENNDRNREAPQEPQAKRQKTGGDAVETCLCVLDFEGAFLQLACRNMNHNVLSWWCMEQKKYRYAKSAKMNFGSKAAVVSWVRVSQFYKFLLADVCELASDIYIDDSFTVERLELAESTLGIMRRTAKCTGLKISEAKTIASQDTTLLGVHYNLKTAGVIQTSLREGKMIEIKKNISAAITAANRGTLEPKALQKIAGVLNFAAGALRFAVLKSCLRPIYKYTQHEWFDETNHAEIKPILYNLRAILAEFRSTLVDIRRIQSGGEATIFSDASEDKNSAIGGAFLIKTDPVTAVQEVYYFKITFPRDKIGKLVKYKSKLIAFLELVTVAMALKTWASMLRDSIVTCYIDNTAAIFSILKGQSKDMFLRFAALAFYKVAITHNILVNARYVKSGDNVSDGLTRPDLEDIAHAVMRDAFGGRSACESEPDVDFFNEVCDKILVACA